MARLPYSRCRTLKLSALRAVEMLDDNKGRELSFGQLIS